MPTTRCFAGCPALSKVQELGFQCMCAKFWPISLSCHMTFNTHHVYTYSQILTSNGIPHIHVFSKVYASNKVKGKPPSTHWAPCRVLNREGLNCTKFYLCSSSTVASHSIPMDSYFLWHQASQRIGTNACQFPVSNGDHRFSEIRTKNGKFILLQNK